VAASGTSRASARRGTRTFARLIQLAWRWVRFQLTSDVTAWFLARTTGNSKRSRRITIVAVARKLLIALWRYATTGLMPAGARIRTAQT
jgi:transposase